MISNATIAQALRDYDRAHRRGAWGDRESGLLLQLHNRLRSERPPLASPSTHPCHVTVSAIIVSENERILRLRGTGLGPVGHLREDDHELAQAVIRIAARVLGISPGGIKLTGKAPVGLRMEVAHAIRGLTQPRHVVLSYVVRVRGEMDGAWEWVPLSEEPDPVLRDRLASVLRMIAVW